MRKPIIAGNWKMNNTIKESIKAIEEIKKNLNLKVDIVICAPYTSLQEISKRADGTNLKIGAQNVHWEENGAYTGEISAEMLEEINIDYVIIGHSERREYFNENDRIINKKMKKAIAHNIKPILCVGESLSEREKGLEKAKVKSQVLEGLKGIDNKKLEEVIVAYEPIWAIGTGKTATSDQANEIIAYIRTIIKENIDDNVAEKMRIQYGGSVNPNNIDELMSKSDIDGALVGGASLEADDFIKLFNFNVEG